MWAQLSFPSHSLSIHSTNVDRFYLLSLLDRIRDNQQSQLLKGGSHRLGSGWAPHWPLLAGSRGGGGGWRSLAPEPGTQNISCLKVAGAILAQWRAQGLMNYCLRTFMDTLCMCK